jgi:tetratricopeptide (TPR) repeat protein
LTPRALLGAATIHIDRSEFDQADDNVRAARALCESLPGAPPAGELATALNCMAVVSFHRGQFEQAEACYAKLLGDLTSGEENAVLRGIVANDLAAVKIALQEPGQAIEPAQAAAKIMEQQFGPASAHYARCLDTLAQALLAGGQPLEAEKMARQSLEICAADAGADSAQYGATLLTLSKIQHVAGDHAAAVHTAERSIGLQHATRGALHPLKNRAQSELDAMRQEHQSHATLRRQSPDELQMFDEMYAGLGLTPDELTAPPQHWRSRTGPERTAHYLDFHAQVAARRSGAKAAAEPPDEAQSARPASDGPSTADNRPAPATDQNDEALLQELFGRHKLAPEVQKERRAHWDRLTPEQRRAAEAGDFESAITWEYGAIDLVPENEKAVMRARARLYENYQKYRDIGHTGGF